MIKDDVNKVQDIQLDYIEIVNPYKLQTIKRKRQTNEEAVALIAVFLGNVRLIDNLSLND